jgi:Eco57I restriction-modification methylase
MNATVSQTVSRPASLPGFCPIEAAIDQMASAGIEERGAIFTRREVVEFILDLVGYTADKPLHEMRLLEPSFGDGDFLIPAIERLLLAWQEAGQPNAAAVLANAICGVELHEASYDGTKLAIAKRLEAEGIAAAVAAKLASGWLIRGDFLLADLSPDFDTIVGNPPYVRQELIPDILMTEYRARYATIFDRADIYVPFIERSLDLLKAGGECGYICSDRWMKNRYGGPLRAKVSSSYHLKTFVDMVGTEAFNVDVVAYPAITVIARGDGIETRVVQKPDINARALTKLASDLKRGEMPSPATGIAVMEKVTSGSEPWLLESSKQLALVRRLEAEFLPIEQVGCKVGIGVATGADKAFIGKFAKLDVEPSRKLPLAMTRDISGGQIEWRGYGVINPFGDDGKLVDLNDFPKLTAYLEARRAEIAGRHVAKKAPARWFRTIDRIHPELAKRKKLLIPDIKGDAQIVFEDGELYPHHNLYFIVTDEWEIRALQAVLLSGIARLFVATYSTKMRGGFFRYQAQYLRRIRLPRWQDVGDKLRNELSRAAASLDYPACNRAVAELYRLTEAETHILLGEM